MLDQFRLALKAASEQDKEFCKRVHHLAYRDVVARQFGAWDEAVQDTFFEKKWMPPDLQVIYVNDEPVGSLVRTILSDHMWIAEIQLLPAFQSRGIGREILKRLKLEASCHSIPIRLQVLKANDRARKLYRELGFHLNGASDNHFQMEWNCRPVDLKSAPEPLLEGEPPKIFGLNGETTNKPATGESTQPPEPDDA